MKQTALMVCKGLIPEEKIPALVPLLPREDQEIFEVLPHPWQLFGEHLKWDLLDHIHFSWLAPYLRTLSATEIKLFLTVLSAPQRHGLEKLLGYENQFPDLPKFSKSGLREFLLSQVKQNLDLVPFAFLPNHPLNKLLQQSSDTIAKVIRYLGLHDLSYEMRQIIDTKELKRIFASLTEKEGEYLNKLMLHTEPLIFKRLFLKEWKGTKEDLHKLLEERGAHRLGHLLYDSSESLKWYLSHSLEMHLGTKVLKYIEKPTHVRAHEILMRQIEMILNFIKAERSS